MTEELTSDALLHFKKYETENIPFLSCGGNPHMNFKDLYKCREELPYIKNASIEIKEEITPNEVYKVLFNGKNAVVSIYKHIYVVDDVEYDDIPLFRSLCLWNTAGVYNVSSKIVDHHICKNLNGVTCIITSEDGDNIHSFKTIFEQCNSNLAQKEYPGDICSHLFQILAYGILKTVYLSTVVKIFKSSWDIDDIFISYDETRILDVLLEDYEDEYSRFIDESDVNDKFYGKETKYTKNINKTLENIFAYNILYNIIYFLKCIQTYLTNEVSELKNIYTIRFQIIVDELIKIINVKYKSFFKNFENETMVNTLLGILIFMTKDLFSSDSFLGFLASIKSMKQKLFPSINDEFYETREKEIGTIIQKTMYSLENYTKKTYGLLLDEFKLFVECISKYSISKWRKCEALEESPYDENITNNLFINDTVIDREDIKKYAGYFKLDDDIVNPVYVLFHSYSNPKYFENVDERCIMEKASQFKLYPLIHDSYYCSPWIGEKSSVIIYDRNNETPSTLFELLEEVLQLSKYIPRDKLFKKFILLVCYIVLAYRLVIKMTYNVAAYTETWDLNKIALPRYFLFENFPFSEWKEQSLLKNMMFVHCTTYREFHFFDKETVNTVPINNTSEIPEEDVKKYNAVYNQKAFLKTVLQQIGECQHYTKYGNGNDLLCRLLKEFVHFLMDGVDETHEYFLKGGSANIDNYIKHLYMCVNKVILKDQGELQHIVTFFRENLPNK